MKLNWKTILLLAASLFGGFFLTLWLIAPPNSSAPQPTAAFRPEALKTLTGTSNADVLEKLSAAGFRADSVIMGHIDEFKNGPDRSVRITGWAVDQLGDGSPLKVSFYVDGEPRLTVTTAGVRDDVAKSFNLAGNVAKNIGFSGTFTCETTAQAMVLAINPADGRYAQLDQRRCPWALF